MYEQTIKSEYIPRDAVEYIVDNPKFTATLHLRVVRNWVSPPWAKIKQYLPGARHI